MRSIAQVFVFALFASGGCAAELSITATAPNGVVDQIPATLSKPDGPGPSGRADVGPQRRAADAYAALAYLRTQSYVDGRRVGVMGGSHGGSSTLAT